MKAWRQHLLESERSQGHRNLPARRFFNRTLQGGGGVDIDTLAQANLELNQARQALREYNDGEEGGLMGHANLQMNVELAEQAVQQILLGGVPDSPLSEPIPHAPPPPPQELVLLTKSSGWIKIGDVAGEVVEISPSLSKHVAFHQAVLDFSARYKAIHPELERDINDQHDFYSIVAGAEYTGMVVQIAQSMASTAFYVLMRRKKKKARSGKSGKTAKTKKGKDVTHHVLCYVLRDQGAHDGSSWSRTEVQNAMATLEDARRQRREKAKIVSSIPLYNETPWIFGE